MQTYDNTVGGSLERLSSLFPGRQGNELSDIELDLTRQGFGKLQVRQQENFQPVPLKKLRDSRLQEFLARMGE